MELINANVGAADSCLCLRRPFASAIFSMVTAMKMNTRNLERRNRTRRLRERSMTRSGSSSISGVVEVNRNGDICCNTQIRGSNASCSSAGTGGRAR